MESVRSYDVSGNDKTDIFSAAQGDTIGQPTGLFVDEIGKQTLILMTLHANMVERSNVVYYDLFLS